MRVFARLSSGACSLPTLCVVERGQGREWFKNHLWSKSVKKGGEKAMPFHSVSASYSHESLKMLSRDQQKKCRSKDLNVSGTGGQDDREDRDLGGRAKCEKRWGDRRRVCSGSSDFPAVEHGRVQK